jgi:hypothetical protein
MSKVKRAMRPLAAQRIQETACSVVALAENGWAEFMHAGPTM